MDLSKLPRLSETDKHTPPPAHETPPPATAMPATSFQTPVAEVWINIALGVILQLMSTRFWSFGGSKLLGSQFTWTFSDATGVPITFTQSVFFLGDLAMVLFGFVLIFEGLIFMLSQSRMLLQFAFALTCVATVCNLLFVIQMMSGGYGLQLMSAIAVALGVYIAMNQWKSLQLTRI